MNLDILKSRIDTFVEFARKFPATYRPAIITYLLQLDAAERGAGSLGNDTGKARISGMSTPTPSAQALGTVHPAIIEVAMEIKASPEVVDRRLVTITDGRPDLRWKSEGVAKAKRQIDYVLVYTFVLEKLGDEGAPLTELRNLCIQKRAYDQANFMANLRRQRDNLQLADLPGGQEQEVVLTGPGRQRARDLLSAAAEEMVPLPAIVGAPISSVDIEDAKEEGDDKEKAELSELAEE